MLYSSLITHVVYNVILEELGTQQVCGIEEHVVHSLGQSFCFIGADDDVAAKSQLCVGASTVHCPVSTTDE